MSQVKPTKRSFQAAPGLKLPILYRGEIVRIADKPVEFVWEEMDYESKIHIKQALKAKEITEVKAVKSREGQQGV